MRTEDGGCVPINQEENGEEKGAHSTFWNRKSLYPSTGARGRAYRKKVRRVLPDFGLFSDGSATLRSRKGIASVRARGG